MYEFAAAAGREEQDVLAQVCGDGAYSLPYVAASVPAASAISVSAPISKEVGGGGSFLGVPRRLV